MKSNYKFAIYMLCMMISIIPAILLASSSPWFLYQNGLPETITLNLQTKITFYLAFASILATVTNFVIVTKIMQK